MKRVKIIVFLLLLIIILPFGVTFSKYVTRIVKNYLMEANNFFFNSDKLVYGGINYEINDWSGSVLEIQFELNNHKNNILTSDTDISYLITLECDDNTECSINQNGGTIYQAEMADQFVVTVDTIAKPSPGDVHAVTITATSNYPYVKELSATFILTIGNKYVDFEITDSNDSPYFMLSITNPRDTYKVFEAINGHNVGDILSIDEYTALSSSDKTKCASARLTLSFDPSVVVIDTTSEIMKISTYQTTLYNGVNYVSSITFGADALSSYAIRFYKRNRTLDYTYPIGNNTSIVSVTSAY